MNTLKVKLVGLVLAGAMLISAVGGVALGKSTLVEVDQGVKIACSSGSNGTCGG